MAARRLSQPLLGYQVGDGIDESRSSSAPLTRSKVLKQTNNGRRRSGSAGRAAVQVVHEGVRQRDKLVPLPEAVSPPLSPRQPPLPTLTITPFSLFDPTSSPTHNAVSPDGLAPAPPDWNMPGDVWSNVGVLCVCDAFDLDALETVMGEHSRQYKVQTNCEVLCAHISEEMGDPRAAVFIFAYGVVVLWGMGEGETDRLMWSIKQCCLGKPLPPLQVERDKFQVQFTGKERPHILNDIITIHRSCINDSQVKLAISHALAQSTKLAVYEERVSSLIESTRHLPEQLADTGHVKIERTQLAQIIGEVYLQRSHVNLLSSVMDTPDFFWDAPDQLQELYKALTQYLELEDRLEVINSRFTILGEMLDLLRDHQATHHGHSLEWVVICLILLEVVIGCAQIAEMFGFL